MLGDQTSLGSSKRIPFLKYIGRTIFLNDGSCLAKMIEPKIQEIPLIITVWGAPILVAMKPANKLPKGVILLNAIA
jgi:hypothetical protein